MRTERSAEFLTLRTGTQLRKFFEERLYLARRLQSDYQSSRPLPDVCPHMRHLSWRENAISRPQLLVALLADLDHVLALDDVEPLFLLVVQVPRWAAFVDVDELTDGEAAVGVQGR